MTPAYSALQISRALEVSPQAVRKALRLVSPSRSERNRGQEFAVWSLGHLPDAWQARISKLIRQRGCRNFGELTQQDRFAPSVALDHLPAEALGKAVKLRQHLGQVLTLAESLSVRQMALRVQSSLARDEAFRYHSTRTLRRIIERVLQRDAGWAEFDRLELYAEEFAQDLPAAPLLEKSPINCPAVGFVIEMVPREDEKFSVRLLEAARMDFAQLAPVHGQRRTKAALLDALVTAGNSLSASREGLRKRLDRFLKPAACEPANRPGRKAKFMLTDEEQRRLIFCRLERGGSLARAIYDFKDDAICSAETRELILDELDLAASQRRRPKWPESLHDLTLPTDALTAHFYGPKHRAKFQMKSRRGLFFENEQGERIQLQPNHLWESDDMSTNEPFRFMNPETGEWQLGRQMLLTLDVASGFWLAANAVGRDRDSYRAEDIADHVRNLVSQHGLPLCWRIEKGRWDNNFIWGAALREGGRWGGLDELIHIEQVHTSNGKGLIESRFNPLQRETATMSLSIGRERGQKESGTKHSTAAKRGNMDSMSKFWTMQDAVSGHIRAMERMNSHPMQRKALGGQAVIPEEVYQLATKRECPDSEMWRFLPQKQEATVRGGHVEVKVRQYARQFRFRLNGESTAYFHQGQTVLIAFHPGRPEEGCHIFDGEREKRPYFNMESSFGRFLLLAPYEPEVAQFSLSGNRSGSEGKKKANAAMVSLFRGIVPRGQKAVSVSEARDGLGTVSRRSENADPRMEPNLPAGEENRQHEYSRMITKAKKMSRAEEDAKEAQTLDTIQKLEAAMRERGEFHIG